MPELPARPSAENLRKQAKRNARADSIRLADAQHRLANAYGYSTWAELMRFVERSDPRPSPALMTAVRARDIESVRRLLAGGANPNLGDEFESPLHLAARLGPLELVEVLIAGGALDWQPDARGQLPLESARLGRSVEKQSIITLLDRATIDDAGFRAAVAALHAGDVLELERLIDAEPRLLRERIAGPEAYRLAVRHQYFRDPKLFWYVANNPATVEQMPANIVEVAAVMIERGVERSDLDYALELTMTSRPAREQGHQLPLVRLLIGAGAVPTRKALMAAAAYGELEIVRALIDLGHPLDAQLAAALGNDEALFASLGAASVDDVQAAFGLAVINRNLTGARAALDAGADVNAFLPVHAHSTALHQAANNDDVALIGLLLERGARPDSRDKLWDATPLEWAIHEGNPAARAALEETATTEEASGSASRF